MLFIRFRRKELDLLFRVDASLIWTLVQAVILLSDWAERIGS